jgi:uncharacterized protein YkwD
MSRIRRLAALTGLAVALSGAAVTVTTAPAYAGTSLSTLEKRAVAATNKERAKVGCKAVRRSGSLTKASRAHSADMVRGNYFGHTSPDGRTFVQRAGAAGHHRPVGENIAWGQRTAAQVIGAWMNSPGHRANILNCTAKTIGVGVARKSNGTLYWTQLFGG